MSFKRIKVMAVAVVATGGVLAVAAPAFAASKAPAKVTICHFENTNHVGDGLIGTGLAYEDAAACVTAGGTAQTIAAKALKGHRLA